MRLKGIDESNESHIEKSAKSQFLAHKLTAPFTVSLSSYHPTHIHTESPASFTPHHSSLLTVPDTMSPAVVWMTGVKEYDRSHNTTSLESNRSGSTY